jgi:glycosyltransferase involved in cell wall biosynthesis
MITKQVRVLYEIHPHILGGTERFLVRFLELLDRRRYEPIIFSQKMGAPLQLIRSLGMRAEVIADASKAKGIQRLADFIKANRIGLVQSNYYAPTLALAANLADVPHIWRIGGHITVGSGTRTPEESRQALSMIGLLSKSIICNSNYVRRQFRSRTSAPSIEVIPNGAAITSHGAYVKKRKGEFRIGMIAHFIPQKRHIDFIRAAEIITETRDDVTFAILGSPYAHSASRSYAAKIARRTRGLQSRGKLSISEFVECESEVLNAFDIIVLPSEQESFSNAILEAMAAGIPVVATRSGGNAELVEHRKTGLLVPPRRPEALARAILSLIKDENLRGRMGCAARRRAEIHFPMEACVRSYEAVYSRVIFALK